MSLQNPIFIPGPTNMPEALRRACDMPTIDHRSAQFAPILQAARSGVAHVIKSDVAEVFIFPSSGSGGWETAISNTLSAGDTVLAARNGMFSHKWIDMCQRFGLNVDVLDVVWGEGLPVDRYAAALAGTPNIASKRFLPRTTKPRRELCLTLLPCVRHLIWQITPLC